MVLAGACRPWRWSPASTTRCSSSTCRSWRMALAADRSAPRPQLGKDLASEQPHAGLGLSERDAAEAEARCRFERTHQLPTSAVLLDDLLGRSVGGGVEKAFEEAGHSHPA